MPKSIGLQVVHPLREDISRGASEKWRKSRKRASVNNRRTRAAKVKANAEYNKAISSVNLSIRADERNYVETLATEAKRGILHVIAYVSIKVGIVKGTRKPAVLVLINGNKNDLPITN